MCADPSAESLEDMADKQFGALSKVGVASRGRLVQAGRGWGFSDKIPTRTLGPSSPPSPFRQAWLDGMYRVFNGSADQPGSAEWELYDRPLPTITVTNIVPEVNPGQGPTSFSIV